MTKTPTQVTKKPTTKKSPIGLYTSLLLILTFTNIGYLGYAHHQVQIQAQHERAAWQDILQQTQQNLDKSTQKINALQNSLETQQKNLQQQIDTLQQQVHAFINDTTNAEQAWVVQKAIYYLQMAQISNRWDNDRQAAIRWLNESSTLLKNHQTASFDSALQKIAVIQTKLSTIPNQNTETILDQIATLQNSLDNLFADTADNSQIKPEKANCEIFSKKSNKSTWQEYKNNVSCIFQKFIVIHRPNDKDMELLSPLYQRTMQEKILLELAQVQWAFLQNNSRLYKQGLQQIRKDIVEKFNTNNPHVQTVLDGITQLQTVSLNSMQINFAPLISELQQMIDQKEQLSGG